MPSANRIAVLVDVQNIYYTTRDTFGRAFNYRALWKSISQQGEIVVANAYATDKGDDGQHKFQSALRHIGFNVRLKPYIQRADGSAKGDWDVGITIDALEAAPAVDTLILLSGDGDFDRLLKHVAAKHGISTEVYGVPSLTANSLIQSCAVFHPISDEFLL